MDLAQEELKFWKRSLRSGSWSPLQVLVYIDSNSLVSFLSPARARGLTGSSL